jgi:mannobiose 2-epimerase
MNRAGRRSNEPQMPTADELESVLRQHVLDVWFPRCLDLTHGGFLCDFDRTWKPRGRQEKLLEFQARQTLVAAEASRAYPDDQRLRQAALHGFRYLRDVMWDTSSGGWFHSLDRTGQPLYAHTKHAHGTAYAIKACVAVHEATAEPGALELAQEAFNWLQDFSYDREHGGYFGFLKRDGTVVREASQCPWKATCDVLGTPIGLKDTNVHSDLLETLAYLARVTGGSKVTERLAELVDVFCDKILLHYYYQADWTLVPHVTRFGYLCQNAFRLLLASEVIGNEPRLGAAARRAIDHMLQFGWDHGGAGIFYAGPACTPTSLHGHSLIVRHKSWWVQFEGLKALAAIGRFAPESDKYRAHSAALWNYVRTHFIDFRHGGTYTEGLDGVPRWRRRLGARFAPAAAVRKGGIWKDASHDGRALMYMVAALRAQCASTETEEYRQEPSRKLARCA